MPILELIHTSPFFELAALLALAAIVGFAGLLLRQPLIVSFIAVGVLAGPSALGIVRAYENIELLAELGVAVLLFLVGLKLDLNLIRTLGVVSLATGLGQVLFTSIIGALLGLLLGLDLTTTIYVAVALTFSSTIIIVKLLSDKREVDSLHGRIALGFLIVQDLVVVIAMITLAAFSIGGPASGQVGIEQETGSGSAPASIARMLVYGVIMLGLLALFMQFVAEPLVRRIARSQELLVTFAIAWAALLAAACSMIGFSMELGGLLAGISLASTSFRESIVARLAPLRDFLLLFFFIALGSKLDLSILGAQIVPAIVFSLFVLIGNPIIVMAIMGYMGYRKRTSFLAGLTVAQISEFSLIFVAMGLSLGHIAPDTLGLVTLVGMITIALSVYMITYSHPLYRWLEPLLGPFERKTPHREPQRVSPTSEHGTEASISHPHDVVLFGLGRFGTALAQCLSDDGQRLLAIDFNPDEVRRWRERGFDAIYGDACDLEFVDSLPLLGVRWVIATLPQHDIGLTHEDPRLVLIQSLRSRQYAGKIAVTAHSPIESERLQARGADIVLLPFQDAASQAAQRVMLADSRA